MDFDKTDLKENVLIITNDDGSITCIPEEGAIVEEQAMFTEFRTTFPNGKPVVVSLEDTKTQKVAEMNSVCEDKIVNEFYSSCLGESKRFDCTLTDQTNIMSLTTKAQLILGGVATDTILDWKESGVAECYPFTTTQAITLGSDLFNHITENRKQYEKLKKYILELIDIKVIQAITWDTVIPKYEE